VLEIQNTRRKTVWTRDTFRNKNHVKEEGGKRRQTTSAGREHCRKGITNNFGTEADTMGKPKKTTQGRKKRKVKKREGK